MNKTYLLTGATGFLGSLLALELIKNKDKLIFLGRSKDGDSFEQRIKGKLKKIDGNISFENMGFLEIDLGNNNLGLSPKTTDKMKNKADGIWHLAANLSFKKEDRGGVFETNVNGLKNILDLADKINAPAYYTSTAYVNGKRQGLIYEKNLTRPKGFNNPYEESKFEAEKIITKWEKENKKRSYIIFRPGILVEKEGRAAGFFGYYVVLSSIYKLGKKLPKKFRNLPVPFPYNKKVYVNLMPAKTAVEWMAKIAEDPNSADGTFHITNPHPFPIKEVVEQTFKISGLRVWLFPAPLWFVNLYFFLFTALGKFTPLKKIAQKFYYYKCYMVGRSTFDMSNTKKIISEKKVNELKFDGNFVRDIAEKFIKAKSL